LCKLEAATHHAASKMVKVVTQETFDSYVRENMEEFEMSKEEAIQEAKDQLLAQGVNMSNLVMGLEEDSEVVKAVAALKRLSVGTAANEAEVVKHCDVLAGECGKGMAEKLVCTKNDGYDTLLAMAKEESTEKARVAAFKALASLMDKNPDVFDPQGFVVIADGLQPASSSAVQSAALDMVLSCCVLHEMNRQNLVKNGILEKLAAIVKDHPLQVARVWQALVQDDDVRVTAGNAHQTARSIVEESLATTTLLKLMEDNLENGSDLKQYLSTLSSLTVRNEYCMQVANDGGLRMITQILSNPDQSKPVIVDALKLVKTLAGNDDVKRDVAASGGVPLIVATMNRHMTSGPIIHAGCAAITAICLRTPKNAEQVMDNDGAQLLTNILNSHMKNAKIMVACCNAIRNIVSRSKQLSKNFVDLGVEPLLNQVLKTHPAAATNSAKAALRDLGLKVHLKEEWTGSKVEVSQSQESSIKDLPEELQ